QGDLSFEGTGSFFEVRNKAFCVMLAALGAPNGDKVVQETRIPEWIRAAPLFIKREFLAAYFGCELSTPKIREKNQNSFGTPVLKFAKTDSSHAKTLLKDFEQLVAAFEITIASVYSEKGNYRKDGTISTIYSVKFSVKNQNLILLFGTIGAAYCRKKENGMLLAGQYLKAKQRAQNGRQLLFEQTKTLRARQTPFKEIAQRTGIGVKMLERWMYYNKERAGLATGFPSFSEWKKTACAGLVGTGLVLETIGKVEEIVLDTVFDLTTQSATHNFFANGFLTGNCKPYNADFDGDEMNLHVPQTEEGKAEAEHLMLVQNQIISPRFGGPVITFEEDGISGAFLLTFHKTRFDRNHMMQMLYNIGETDLPTPDVGKLYSGKVLFSKLLPEGINLEYESFTHKNLEKTGFLDKESDKNKYDTIVSIKNSKMESGIIDAETLGESRGKLVDYMAREYPRGVLVDFYQKTSRAVIELLTLKGLTVGLDEYETSKDTQRMVQKAVEEEMEEAAENVKKHEKGTLEHIPGRTGDESFEIYMMRTAGKVKKKVENQIMREKVNDLFASAHPKYNSMVMILAKSRGSSLNLVNISGLWGQAAVREGRPRRGYHGRLITGNREGDVGALAGGFIRRNFMDGLDTKEFFYHSMGGRQGEVDTGVATKVSGYLYRRLANSLKDLVVIEDGSVRTAAGNIIQFIYGEDGVFPAKAYHSKSVDARKEYKKFSGK
ncbi:MAG: hypothetical protein Q7R47_06970, partial [Candidatus Diapherotrites archaeon]|nr:hypothetical protein [Candidatus Diapherotrites archaeon]